MDSAAERVRLTVTDDGTGGTGQAGAGIGGTGLTGLTERLAAAGGSLTAGPARGRLHGDGGAAGGPADVAEAAVWSRRRVGATLVPGTAPGTVPVPWSPRRAGLATLAP